MSYLVVRVYSGQGAHSVDEVLRIAGTELAPELMKQPGLSRYTLFKLDDGRFGSTSLYDDRTSAEAGLQRAAEWVRGTGAMQGYSLQHAYQGEDVYVYRSGDQSRENMPGCIRRYKTSASVQELRAAFQQEAPAITQKAQGLLRFTAVKLDDGLLVLAVHNNAESMRALIDQAKQARGTSGSQIAKVLPNDPELTTGTVIRTFAR